MFLTIKKIAVVAAAALVVLPLSARKATKEYQRPSLHMVLMTSTEEASANTVAITDQDILGYASNSWDTYVFPALYNDFRVATTELSVDQAKGGIMDLLAMYSDPESLADMGLEQLNTLLSMLKGKVYLEALRNEVDSVSNQVAHELVRKWWSIQDDGTCSDTLLMRLSCYSATQNQARDANQTTLGADKAILNELANTVMSSTFATFTKLDFYESEPIAAFTRNVMYAIAAYIPSAIAQVGAVASADITYNAMKEGYTAFAHALLYQLEWNDSIANEFYNIWTDDTHIDMEKFNAMKFNLKYCGATKANATCLVKKDDKGKSVQEMVEKTIYKALDRQFVDMQEAYEEFRPMVPVLGLDAKGGVIADMGTKEGVKVGDSFNLLEPYVNEKGILKYKNIGIIKVVNWKGDAFVDGVWDNQNQDNVEAVVKADGTETEIIGTHLKKFKDATPSMFVKKTKK